MGSLEFQHPPHSCKRQLRGGFLAFYALGLTHSSAMGRDSPYKILKL